MISVSKGTSRERQAVDLLQRAGYATYRPATVRFGENDLWGLFDVLCIAPDLPLRAIQVKSNCATGIRDWSRQTWLWRRHGFLTEYLVPHDGKGWRLIECYTDSHNTVYDERKDPSVGPNRDTPLNMGEGLVNWLRGDRL